MTTYMLDKESRELIPKDEWYQKYGEKTKRCRLMIINKGFDAYESPITPGKIISNHAQRDAEMKQAGVVDYEPSLRQETEKSVNTENYQLEAELDRTVEQEISKMSVDQQSRLENELEAGADISYERL
jgi:hypothetical protein